MSLPQAVLFLGITSLSFPVFAIGARRVSRLLFLAAFLAALTFGVFLFSLFKALDLVPGPAVVPWLRAAVGSGVGVVLSGMILTATLGRREPRKAVTRQLGILLALAVVGLVFLWLMSRPGFIRGLDFRPETWRIVFGPVGKAYLGYLLIGIIFSGYNLERTYRDAGEARGRLRLPLFGFFCLLGYFVYLVTLTLLYSVVDVNRLVASALPLMLASGLVGYGFLRGGLRDTAVPVSRKFVYSSLTVLAAAFYVLSVGILAQIAMYLKWSPGEVVGISLSFLVVVSVLLFFFSSRIQRRIRRFIDLNFYVNRYDYRSQWALLTEHLSTRHTTPEILESARFIMETVFQPGEITLATLDKASPVLRPRLGKGEGDGITLREGDPLFDALRKGRRAIILSGRADDFEYIPIYAENPVWLEGTASHVVAPLLVGDELIGLVGLGRQKNGGSFTYEALDLLDRMTAHFAAVLHNARLTEELTEAREMELLSQWSSFLLHDLKNHLSPLRMIELNLMKHGDNPTFRQVVQRDLEHIRNRMENLVQRLSELRDGPQLGRDTIDINRVIYEILDEYKLYERSGVEVLLDLQAAAGVVGDRAMVHRVLVNLITNAVEAMPNGGVLTVRTSSVHEEEAKVSILVTDTGMGMSQEFIRDRLFRPFATSKKRGLGLGLYQCRTIVQAYGGEISVESRVGSGTSFRVLLPASGLEPILEQMEPVSEETPLRRSLS